MHVCIVDQGEFVGGAELFALDLLRYTAKSKVDFSLLHDVRAADDYLELLETIPYITHKGIYLPSLDPMSPFDYMKGLAAAHSMKRQLKKLRPDVLQSNTARTHVLGAFVAPTLGIPLVWVMHDFTFSPRFLKRYVSVPERIVCVSEAIKSYVLLHAPEAKDKIVVVPNGVHVEKYTQAKPYKSLTSIEGQVLHFHPKTRYVGLIGRIDTWKGQDTFLQAIDILHKEYPQHADVQYLIAGNPTETSEERKTYFQKLQDYKKAHFLKDVHFIGHVDAKRLYQNLDVVVHASTQPEPFGRTIIEAFAAGVPVVASKLGAPASIIQYGKTGLLTEPKDPQDLAQKLSLLFEDTHLNETLKMNAKKEVRAKYTLEKVVDGYYQLWSDVIKCSKLA